MLRQRIVFKDKLLEYNLDGFIDKVKGKIISVSIEKRDNALLYNLSEVLAFESIKDSPPRFWGQWRNRIVVIWTTPELNTICTISDTVAFADLVQYVRPILPDQFTTIITAKGETIHYIRTIEGLEWAFIVENGNEFWLYGNEGHDARDLIPVPLPVSN